jgi:2-keto-4-pentenoate hydratase
MSERDGARPTAAPQRREPAPSSGAPTGPGRSLEEAYVVQDRLIEASGELVVGAAVTWWEPGGICFGWLTDGMWLAPETPVSASRLATAEVAPYLVFRLRTELEGQGITATDVAGATAAVAGGFAVLDPGRHPRPRGRSDLVADNLGLARFAVGSTWLEPRLLDLGLLGCLVELDGEVVAGGAGAALGGQPAQGVAELANHLVRRGQPLPAGSIVAVGSFTEPVPLHPGCSVTATFAHLGAITLRAVP